MGPTRLESLPFGEYFNYYSNSSRPPVATPLACARMSTSPVPVNPLGRTLQIIGDHRNLAIIRGAFRGSRRFGDWQQQLDVSDPVLAGRLRALVDEGVFSRVQYQASPPRAEYRLTDAGKALWVLFVELWSWDRRWTGLGADTRLIHRDCGQSINPLLACGACGDLGVTARDTSAIRNLPVSAANPPRRYRRAARPEAVDTDHNAMSGIDLLGDRWSTSLLAAALLGAHSFGEFQQQLGPVPPLILSDRLDIFVKQQVLTRAPARPGGRRMSYVLAPKGLDFFGVFAAIVAWTNRWLAPPADPPIAIVHRRCGEVLDPALVCNSCGQRLARRTVHFELPAR